MNRDQVYGLSVLALSMLATVVYLVALFPSYFALPSWVAWWAVALPVVLTVLAVLTIGMWIGWVMLTTLPLSPLEPSAESRQERTEGEHAPNSEKE